MYSPPGHGYHSPSNPSKVSLKNKVKELFEGFEGESEGDSFKSEGVFSKSFKDVVEYFK